MNKKAKIYMAIRIIIFLSIIIIPLIFTILKPTTKTIGNEEKVEKPQILSDGKINKDYYKDLDKYFTNSFNIRNELIKLNAVFKYKAFNMMTGDKVIVGKDDWLFLKETTSCYTGDKIYTNEILEDMKRNLMAKEKYLKDQGIELVLTVPPNKNTIYPEYMPEDIKKARENGCIQDFFNYMKSNTDLNVIDLREALKKEKDNNQLYCKRDTHWDHYGAYIAYKEIINEINKKIPKYKTSPKDFKIGKSVGKDKVYDLSSMLLIDGYTDDIITYIENNSPNYEYVINDENEKIIKTVNKDKTLPKAVVFRDSFSASLIPFLSENFSEVTYYWGTRLNFEDVYFNKQVIEENKPDIVIVEMVERYMDNMNFYFDK